MSWLWKKDELNERVLFFRMTGRGWCLQRGVVRCGFPRKREVDAWREQCHSEPTWEKQIVDRRSHRNVYLDHHEHRPRRDDRRKIHSIDIWKEQTLHSLIVSADSYFRNECFVIGLWVYDEWTPESADDELWSARTWLFVGNFFVFNDVCFDWGTKVNAENSSPCEDDTVERTLDAGGGWWWWW